MISRRFIKSSVIYTVAGALPMASAIILLPFYIYHLSTDLYGVLSLYMAFALFVQIVVTFSFDTSVYIHYHELKGDRRKLSEFVSSAFVCTLFIGLVVGTLLTLSGELIFDVVFAERRMSFYPLGIAAVGSGIFQAIVKVYSNLLQSREKPVVFFWVNVLTFALIAALTIVGLQLFPNSLVGPVFGRLLAMAIAGVCVLILVFAEFGIHFNTAWLRNSFSFNAYTFLYQIQLWVIHYVDRFIFLAFLSFHDIGVYDFAFKAMIPLELIMNGLNSSYQPKVVGEVAAQVEKQSTVRINRYYHGLTATMMLVVCGGIVVVPWVIETFVNKSSYQEAIEYLPYLGVLYIFRSIRLYFAAPFSILKFTRPLAVVNFIVSIVKIGLILLLIRAFGIYAVIIASFVVSLIEPWLLFRSIGDRFNFRFNSFKLIIAPTLVTLAVVAGEVIEPDADYLRRLGYLAFALLVLAWTYRSEIKGLRVSNVSDGQSERTGKQ